MSQPEPVSRRLAEFLAEARPDHLPPDVLAHANRAVLDWLGSVMAGALEPPAQMIREVVRDLGTSDDATVVAGGRASAAGAALANGTASHILEFDDVHKGSTLHGAAPIIPAAMAVAEREHVSGRAFLTAVALGYEAALRVGEAVNPSHYRMWHPTGTAATFGSAAAAGSVLGLDAARMNDALGTAGTTAAGLWEFNRDGAMSKHLHPGKAAFNGVLAADLAKHGFTGASRIIEGDRGFVRAFSDGGDPEVVIAGLGTTWKMRENWYKLHSCCGHTHTAIDAALRVRAKAGFGPGDATEQIDQIAIHTYGPGWAIVSEMQPGTPYQAKFSLAYVVAAALTEGVVGLDQFADARFDGTRTLDADLAALMSRVVVVVDPELTAMYPEAWPARLSITLRDGRVFTDGGDFPQGAPEFPATTEQLSAKAHALIAPRYDTSVADRAVVAARGIGDLRDMNDFFPAIMHEVPYAAAN